MIAAKAQTSDTPTPELVSVSPAGNYQLGHEGVTAGPGESITVPADVAAQWARQGLLAD